MILIHAIDKGKNFTFNYIDSKERIRVESRLGVLAKIDIITKFRVVGVDEI